MNFIATCPMCSKRLKASTRYVLVVNAREHGERCRENQRKQRQLEAASAAQGSLFDV